MKKKRTLPESLELLLDTMCNTFGGIMFIAISLIIMSQMLAKSLKDMTTEQYSERLMAQLERQVQVLEQDIVLLQAKIAKQKEKAEAFSPEKKALILQVLDAEQESNRLRADLEQLALKIAAAQEKLKRLLNEEQSKAEELKKLKQKNDAERQVHEKLRQELEREISRQSEQLKAIQPKTLRFAADTQTDLERWFVFAYDNKLYFMGRNFGNSPDVRVETLEQDRVFRVIPVRGTSLSTDPEKDLDRLFGRIDPSQHYIYLTTDNDSYSTLLVTRRYLRNKGYKVWLCFDPKFTFARSAEASRASD